jgi:phospholipase C
VKNALLPVLAALALSACELTPANWGFGAIKTMQTPADPPLKCDVAIPADTQASSRAACTFKAGAKAADTLGVSAATGKDIPIRHVIIMMKENRSFDHLFGKLHDQGQPLTDGIPADFTNPDLAGAAIAPFHGTTTCNPFDPGHQSASMRAGANGGKMDGFVKNAATTSTVLSEHVDSDGHYIMSTYEQTDLPFYYWLANTYALSDRHFAPLVGGTFGNRNFMMFGQHGGVLDTGISYADPATNSIFRTLINAGYTWGAYSDEPPLSTTLGWTKSDPGAHSVQDLYDALDKGTLPNVVFVDANDSDTDDHPPGDLQKGEAWLRTLYTHATGSPQWERLAILWTYDEGGGYFDHLPPPAGCAAVPGGSTDRGVRIPLVAISPWAKRHAVSHVVTDHTAITRFIETIFDLPALTARDANSDALLNLFDFSCGRDLAPPANPPLSATGSCTK